MNKIKSFAFLIAGAIVASCSSHSDGGGSYLIEGTFSFSAINPQDNSTIQVTNGKFKEYFNW